jgi:hypothetical protein
MSVGTTSQPRSTVLIVEGDAVIARMATTIRLEF